MNAFQIAGLALTALFALAALAARRRGRLGRRTALAWLGLWAAAAAAIARPGLTVVAARALGIDRGADLVFYCGMLGMFAGFFAVYLRLRRLEHSLTAVVRELALVRATHPASAPDREVGPGARS